MGNQLTSKQGLKFRYFSWVRIMRVLSLFKKKMSFLSKDGLDIPTPIYQFIALVRTVNSINACKIHYCHVCKYNKREHERSLSVKIRREVNLRSL